MKNETHTRDEMVEIITQSKRQFLLGIKLPYDQFCDEKFTNSLMKFFDIKPFTLKDYFIEMLEAYRKKGSDEATDFLACLITYLRNS